MMSGPVGIILGVVLAVAIGVVLVVFLLVPLAKGIGWLAKHVFRFVTGEIGDAFRILGAMITALFFAFLCVGNIIIGRWSASAHFGRGVTSEFKTMGSALYRMLIGHPARLLCLTSLTEGIEHRLPQMMADTPTSDTPSRRTGQFEGYRIVGSIAAGGSGGKLFVAEPDDVKLAAFARNGIIDARQVVIKSFSLKDGSSLPQIVRESRSLDAAKKLGLILDHELSADRFYYVMRYVPGQPLSQITKQLHAQSGAAGLAGTQLRAGMTFIADLVATLETYHRGGLWHKDVKPDNIIVDGTRAHLVDFGLITPLRSAMTLTTHGTEYFRDPEMVRLALRGVKVHEVDGTKFDIYGAGAVMYSVLEDSFPAHGVLSAFSKSSPEALRWIVRRAMSDYDKRYATAGEMLADLRYAMSASDPASVKPFELPSMRGAAGDGAMPNPGAAHDERATPFAGLGAAAGAGAGAQEPSGFGRRATVGVGPKIRVVNWWTGKSELESGAAKAAAVPAREWPGAMRDMGAKVAGDALGAAAAGIAAAQDALGKAGAKRHSAWTPRAAGTAAEQLNRARARVQEAQERAKARYERIKGGAGPKRFKNGVTGGVIVALGLVGVTLLVVQGIAKRERAWREHESEKISLREWADDAVVVMELPRGRNESEAPPPPMPPVTPVTPMSPVAAVRAPVPPTPAGSVVVDMKVSARTGGKPKSPAGSEILKTYEGRTILMVNEILPPMDAKTVELLDRSTEAMVLQGFNVIGNVPGRKVSEMAAEEKEREDALIAEARRVQGARPIDAKETRESMEKWLSEGEGRPDLVVWVTEMGESTAKKPRLFVFARDGTGAGRAMAEGVKRAIVMNSVR
jgi:serine/threonine protein kinase